MTHPVLVVDDDREIRVALMEALEEHGYTALGAANGRDALEQLEKAGQRQLPCLIVLDLMMPVMDGRSFREEQLRKPEFAAIPEVVLSAYQDVAKQAAELQVAEHLQKPLDVADLIEAARRYCPP